MNSPYSMRSAVGYALILLVLLWWLPIIGPIIIGYITGRKAGGPVKGIMAMSVPITLYFFLIYAISIGWINVPPIVQGYFRGSVIGGAAGSVFIPYLKETINTAMRVGNLAASYLYYAPSSIFIMLSFAFIGGTMSRQIILERRYGLRKPGEIEKTPRFNTSKREKKRKIKDMDKDSKFVIHPMDTKKDVPLKEKRYGITFL